MIRLRNRLVGIALFPLLLAVMVVWSVADFLGRCGRRK